MIEELIVPSFSPPLEINDDFIVSNLSSPPLPLPERIPKVKLEKLESKSLEKTDKNNSQDSIRRDKTEINKPKEEVPKMVIFYIL